MPTVYTASLDENPAMSTKQWIMEHLTRAFGICIMLRDYRSDLSEREILDIMSQDTGVDYAREHLEENQKKLKVLNRRSEQQWITVWNEHEDKTDESNRLHRLEANEIKENHTQKRA